MNTVVAIGADLWNKQMIFRNIERCPSIDPSIGYFSFLNMISRSL